MATYEREGISFQSTGVHTQVTSGTVTGTTVNNYVLKFQGTKTSRGNRISLLGKTNSDIGAGFSVSYYTWKPVTNVIACTDQDSPADLTFRHYFGPYCPIYINRSTPPTGYGVPSLMSNSDMIYYGAKGVALASPTSPSLSMAQLSLELKEMIKPSPVSRQQAWKDAVSSILRDVTYRDLVRRYKRAKNQTARQSAKNAADTYLSLQFGYLPLVRDIRDFYKETEKLDKKVAFLVRNSGKNVRRRRTLNESSEIENHQVTDTSCPGAPVLSSTYRLADGRLTRTVILKEKVWFSGCFTYYLPDIRNPSSKSSAKKRIRQIIFDDRVTPEALWAVAPWTWALGWVSNSSHVARNLQNFSQDGLVMRYGYVMCTRTREVTFSLSGVRFKDLKFGSANCSQTCILTSKRRVRATPFGFAPNPSSFTDRQWSIIAALGISKGHKNLDIQA